MKKILIYYKPENIDVAVKLCDNYLAHGYGEVDIISEKEQDDIEYARRMEYDEAIFIENSNTVIIHDIKTWYTERLPISDVYFKD
ncbi:hypothetical protein SAMN06297422_12663 [Lachnospiraceae bacterium]|nr:hypothetical protein SAMN06297422_12663 [Lachnospiraceae bacterium]